MDTHPRRRHIPAVVQLARALGTADRHRHVAPNRQRVRTPTQAQAQGQTRRQHATPARRGACPASPSEPAVAILAIGILVLLPFLVLTVLAFSRATSTRHAVKIPYTQSGAFSYYADTAPNPAYPDGVASTDEPLFTQLVNDVNLRFHYEFATSARHAIAGKGSFLLLLTANDGWHRTLPLGSPTYFKGDHATIASTLDLNSLFALTRNIEATTHVDSGYTFAVVPTVVTSGNVERRAASRHVLAHDPVLRQQRRDQPRRAARAALSRKQAAHRRRAQRRRAVRADAERVRLGHRRAVHAADACAGTVARVGLHSANAGAQRDRHHSRGRTRDRSR